MNATFNKHILTFFFCAFALIALSACGGSSAAVVAVTTQLPSLLATTPSNSAILLKRLFARHATPTPMIATLACAHVTLRLISALPRRAYR